MLDKHRAKGFKGEIALLILLLIWVVILFIPAGLVVLVTMWTGRLLARAVSKRVAWTIAAVLPMTVLASEIYPMWLVRSIAHAPARDEATRVAPTSVRAAYEYPAAAAELAVSYPNVQFAEADIHERDRQHSGVFRFDRMPLGPVRFQGSRKVARAEDCAENEVSVATSAPYPQLVQWHCTHWMPIARHAAEFTIGNRTFRNYAAGPYEISEIRDGLVRVRDGRMFNIAITAESTGGLWWRAAEWLGDKVGISAVANGNTVGRYAARTAPSWDGNSENYLLTGKTGRN